MNNIEGLVKRAKNIPVLPQVSSKLLAVFNDSGAEAKDVIKIGFMGNLASPASLSSRAAAQLAVDEMNTAGGILGHKIELIIEDTKGEIPKCVEMGARLILRSKIHYI